MAFIYKLQFDGDERVYIGQTTRTIEGRVSAHYRKLHNNNHHSKKLQEAYNTYKKYPLCTILLECAAKEMDSLEIKYISEYDSFKNGFNGTIGGSSGSYGEDHPQALYSLDDYHCVLSFLAYTDLTHSEICFETGVNRVIVSSICGATHHTYLKELFPEEYELMLLKTNRHCTVQWPNIVDPDGNIHKVSNASDFAKKYNLNPNCLRHVLQGRTNYHKEWHREDSPKYIEPIYTILNPFGILYTFTNIRQFAISNNLDPAALRRVLIGKSQYHKGWEVPIKGEINASN